MAMPFIEHNCILFECQSGKLCVGDLTNEAACYDMAIQGICHLPAAAIRTAKATDRAAFAIDNAQFFLIDAESYGSVRNAVLAAGMTIPDYDMLEKLRHQHRTAFGYVIAGDLHDCEFDGDGTYKLDLTLARTGRPSTSSDAQVRVKERLRRIISSMNTLVCARCLSEEIQEHPQLGVSPSGSSEKKRWAAAMADHALAQGWTAIPEQGSFGEITPLCPTCRKTREQ